jgi:hypothetical protein
MHYQLWSRGRLLGETHLGFARCLTTISQGWFHPNALGERLMPMATGVAPAARTLHVLGSDETARADLLAAVDQEEALELELRGENGSVIPTEDIGIIDTHYLLSLARREDGLELGGDDAADVPRYQIQIRFAGELLPWNGPAH